MQKRGDIETPEEWLKFGKALETGSMFNYGFLIPYERRDDIHNTQHTLIPARKYPNTSKSGYMKTVTIEGILPKDGTRGFLSEIVMSGGISAPVIRDLWFYNDMGNKILKDIVKYIVFNIFNILETDSVIYSNANTQYSDYDIIKEIENQIAEQIENNKRNEIVLECGSHYEYDKVFLFEISIYDVVFQSI